MGRARLNGQSGSGFPAGWKEEVTSVVTGSAISKGDAVVVDTNLISLTKIANPSVLPPSMAYNSPTNLVWANTGLYCAIQNYIYKIANDIATKLSSTISGRNVFWSPSDKYIISAQTSGTFYLQKFENDILTDLTISGSSPIAGFAYDVAWIDDVHFYVTSGSSIFYGSIDEVAMTYTFQASAVITQSSSYSYRRISLSKDANYLVCAFYSGSTSILSKLELYSRSGYTTFTQIKYEFANSKSEFTSNSSQDRSMLKLSEDGTFFLLDGAIYQFANYNTLSRHELEPPQLTSIADRPNCSLNGFALLKNDLIVARVQASTTSAQTVFYKKQKGIFRHFSVAIDVPTPGGTDRGAPNDFSYDGKYLAVGNYSTSPYVYFYKLNYGNVVKKIAGETVDIGSFSKVGIAKEAGEIGSAIKVNLFPKINNV